MKKNLYFIFIFYSFIFKAQDIKTLLNKIENEKDKDSLEVFYKKAAYYYENINVDKAIDYQKKRLEIAKVRNKGKTLRYCYNELGGLFFRKGDLNQAVTNLLESLKISESLNDFESSAVSTLNIGNIYLREKMYEQALNYYTKSLEIKKNNKIKNIASNLFSISNVYRATEKYEKAILFLNEALQSIDTNNKLSTDNFSKIYLSLGVCNRNLNRYDSALYYYKKAELYIPSKEIVKSATLYSNLASLYSFKKDFQQELSYEKKAFAIYTQLNQMDDIVASCKALVMAFNHLKELDSSELYFKKYISLSDSLKKFQNNKIVQEMATKYETEKKESQIKLLAKDKELQNLVINNQQIELNIKKAETKQKENEIELLNKDKSLKEILLQQEIIQKQKKEKENQLLNTENKLSVETIKQQKTITYFIVTALILLIGLSFFIFNGLKNQRKANKIIALQKQEVESQKLIVEQQKQLVEEHQKETLDSIHYAKRIQTALLANKELVDKHLKNNFVFFKPKDIVSGDFYWATEHNNRFYLAICDSTGHGVPGAFMSLLNMGFLSEAIKEKNIENPNEIFNFVRARLESTISNEGQKDGMDGILICLDKKTGELTYSAANNEPILISDNRIIELPKDKMPVGKGEKKESFTLHTISLKPNDFLYLYTDGFADQFGGPKGKKFKYKQLNDLLLEINKEPINKQSEILNSYFENWKGDLEQVDDVCIIGIKI